METLFQVEEFRHHFSHPCKHAILCQNRAGIGTIPAWFWHMAACLHEYMHVVLLYFGLL